RPWSARNCLNFRYVQNSKVRLPFMKPVQRIVIGADVLRQTCTSYRLLEHSTECQAIDNSPLDPESDDSSCVLVHDDQHPIDSQRNKSRLQRLSFIWPMKVSHEGPPSGDVGEYCVARILRTTSLLIHVPKAKLICSAICGLPHDGLRRFISITARIKSAVGPFGPGFLLCFGENSKRYLRCTMSR